MPALITHYLQAKDVYKALDVKTLNEQAFLLGAQGPDFLYYHRAVPVVWHGKSCRKGGTLLHNIPANTLFSLFAKYCTEYPKDKFAYAYALGFLCHYSLDSLAHPYVYAIQKQIMAAENVKYFEGFVHSRIEHNLDIIMLRIKTGKPGNNFCFGDAMTKNEAVLSSCAKIIAYVQNSVSDEKATPKQMKQAFKDMRALQSLSRDSHGTKHIMVRGIEKACFYPVSLSTFVRTKTEDNRFDYANLHHQLWQNPYDEMTVGKTDSFADLMESSVSDSVNLIVSFSQLCKQGKSNVTFTGNRSFKTGLEISADAVSDNTYEE